MMAAIRAYQGAAASLPAELLGGILAEGARGVKLQNLIIPDGPQRGGGGATGRRRCFHAIFTFIWLKNLPSVCLS